MKSVLPLRINSTVRLRLRNRIAARTQVTSHGTPRIPDAPRGVILQPGARKILLNWSLPVINKNITGWRIYKDTESNLAMEIKDKGTRQMFMDVTTADAPPVHNFFVCAVNGLIEGPKVQVQGSAKPETAPTDPTSPPEWTVEMAGGRNRNLR
jgi:hypothetical protein